MSQLPDIADLTTNEEDVLRNIRLKSQEGIMPALWLRVLVNLSMTTTDRRAELRNSAIHTIQRIFENYVDQLSSDAWMLCLRSVLFEIVKANLFVQTRIRADAPDTGDEVAAWNDTTKTVLHAVSKSISMYMEKVEDTSSLGHAWIDLLDLLEQYFDCGSHALGASVFSTITEVLSRIGKAQTVGTAPLLRTATVWKAYFERRELWQHNSEDNQEAFIAYAAAFKAIYRLAEEFLKCEDLIHMLRNLEACVVTSDDIPYSSDVDHMTPVQVQVIECFSLVHTEKGGLPEYLLQTLSSFVTLPYSRGMEQRGPTFVALAKASMELLHTIVMKHASKRDIYTHGAFLAVLTNLEKPIREKYVWHREGKPPTLWQKATLTAVGVLETTISYIKELEDEALRPIWKQIIALVNGVIRAQLSTYPSTLQSDQAFDISAFSQLGSLVTLPLGSSSIPDALRRAHTRNLFDTSILHAPFAGEIPDLASQPLEDLYKVRLGRTDDPMPTFRPEISYAALTELFTLVAHQDCNANERTARVKLAQAAAPYLILRCALPLRAYIADHPLRGRMPQPESQRQELLFVLAELGRLKSEPASIPDVEGVRSKFGKHLHRLYPLFVRALEVSRGDEQVSRGLVKLAHRVGAEFGVDNE